eukprot:3675642-Pyramimonas_sp.AAC.1
MRSHGWLMSLSCSRPGPGSSRRRRSAAATAPSERPGEQLPKPRCRTASNASAQYLSRPPRSWQP